MAESFEPTSKGLAEWLSERTNRDGDRIRQLEIARLGKVWIQPATFFNGYGQAGGDEGDFQYRLYDKDRLQFEGTLVAGISGAHAFTLLEPFWPRNGNKHFVGMVLGTGVTIARFDVMAADGKVYVTYT